MKHSGEPQITLLRELVTSAHETNGLLRVIAMPLAQQAAAAALNEATERAAYTATDGSRSTREVASEVGASKSAVARWWQEWRRLGLVIDAGGGRVRSLFLVEDLNLPPLDRSRASGPRAGKK